MNTEDWISECLPKHERLTESAVSIIKSLLEASGVEFLSITGRTKNKLGIIEKIKRKNYSNPATELTDISGIRIIAFVESDINVISEIIENSFNIDRSNSSNRDEALSLNEVGYRSVHFVCDLGKSRASLPEFAGIGELKFELQIRTVLQHAWAELAHDRSYKFKARLPQEIQRRLYLHAGLLELADRGFSEIAQEIDRYTNTVLKGYEEGNLNIEINSISLTEFIEKWKKENDIKINTTNNEEQLQYVIDELKGFNITKISDLSDIIPKEFANEFKSRKIETNILGLIRDWMIIKDINKLKKEIGVKWRIYGSDVDYNDLELLKKFSSEKNYSALLKYIEKEKTAFRDRDEDVDFD